MFEADNPKHLSKLSTAVRWSVDQLRPHRERIQKLKRQYVGAEYSDNAAPAAVPINIIELGVNTLQRFIASHAPQVSVDSPYRELAPQCESLQLALNQESKRINLGETFNVWAIEALFGMGVLEVGITSKDTPPDGEGALYDPNHLFVDNVLFNRLILDMSVGEWDRQAYIGHEFDVPLEWVKGNPQFDPKVRSAIKASEKTEDRQRDEDTDPEFLALSGQHMCDFDELITLRQIWLRRWNLVLTFAVGQDEKRPLRVTQWEGPERGMYHPLCFGRVPGSLLPNAPVPQWAPIHEMVNKLWNKATAQAERQKTLLLVSGAAAADGERRVNAGDGEAIYSDNPGGCKEWSSGGANEKTLAMILLAKNYWGEFAGNIPLLAGLGPASETAAQDKMLRASASGRTDDMQDVTTAAQQHVYCDMAYWLYTDPLSEYHLVKQVEDTDYFVPSVFTPEQRTYDFTSYNFTVNPYSAQARSPQEEGAEFISHIQMLMQALPLMEQQGLTLDWEWIVKRLAKLRYMPGLSRAIRYAEGEAYPERTPVTGGAGMPNNTTRNYNRRTIPGANSTQQSEQFIKHLLGMGAQPSEMATMARTAG